MTRAEKDCNTDRWQQKQGAVPRDRIHERRTMKRGKREEQRQSSCLHNYRKK